jgi:hypothetical protein
LKTAGIDCDAPITIKAKNIPLRKSLAELLAPFKLTVIVIVEEVVIITTEAGAEEIRAKSPASFILE